MSSENKYINPNYQAFFENGLSKTDPELFKTISNEFNIESVVSIKLWQLDDKENYCELIIGSQHLINLPAVKSFLHDNFNIENCIIEIRPIAN